MLPDDVIINTATQAARALNRRSPWVDLKDVTQEAITIAYEVIAKEYDESKVSHVKQPEAWLAYRIKYRLIDWQRKQKQKYSKRSDLDGIALQFYEYDEKVHAIPTVERGYWFVEELSAYKKGYINHQTDKLSDREKEVLSCFAVGLVTQEVSVKLGLSPHTIAHHTKTCRRKLSARNTTHAVANAIRKGEIQ